MLLLLYVMAEPINPPKWRGVSSFFAAVPQPVSIPVPEKDTTTEDIQVVEQQILPTKIAIDEFRRLKHARDTSTALTSFLGVVVSAGQPFFKSGPIYRSVAGALLVGGAATYQSYLKMCSEEQRQIIKSYDRFFSAKLLDNKTDKFHHLFNYGLIRRIGPLAYEFLPLTACQVNPALVDTNMSPE